MPPKKEKIIGDLQKCTGCSSVLEINETNFQFYKRSYGIYIDSKCRKCVVNRVNNYKNKNEKKVKEYHKTWKANNKDYIKECAKEFYKKNREKIKKRTRDYYYKNKSIILNKQNDRERKRMSKDSNFRLRKRVSNIIRFMLKKHNGSKKGESVLKYLPYTIEELRMYLESLFEPWMNWNNYGVYRACGEKKWQIDHIIPQSKLPYDSMEHENFKKCWALENLRPLEALENIKKGARV